MLEEFIIPKCDPHRGVLRKADANSSYIADVLDDLRGNDALYITEDDNFERCEELTRRFTRLDARQRAAAVDVFAANLSLISRSAKGLLSDQDAALPAAAMRHRSGIKMLVHLLHSIATQAAKDTQASKGAENAVKPKTAGRGRKAVVMDVEDDSIWDWEQGRQRVLSAVRDLITLVDLKALFKGLAAAQQLINLCMELALQGLEAPNVAKQESNWPSCRDVLVRGAVQYQQSEFIAHALMELVRKHEHMPQLAALIAKYAEEHYNSTQLAVMLLTEFSAVAPEEYDTQYGTNQVSVRLAGDLVAALAELMPKVVSNQTSQLQPYLGCSKAYCLRGSLLQAVGNMLVQVYRSDNLSSSLGAGAAAAHLRSKDTLLSLLHARVLDKVSFVRQKVLQTWGKLVEESCVPISHWNMLLQEAIGRLEDDSQLVVKAALQLLHKMVAQGLFQPPLKTHIYINTLHQAEAELAKMQPAKAAVGDGEQEEEEEQESGLGDDEAAADAAADGARWDEGDIHIKEEPTDQPVPEQDGAADGHTEGAKASNDGAIQRMRTMVASLKEGVSFCKHLAATLPQLQVLLANPAAGVVHDAIVFLTLCKTFEVTGAAKALRGMWPLVFSKHEPVRGAVLDSWHILHLHDKLPKQQMEELVMNVIPDCSLSELTALESIIALLVQQDKLSAASLVKQLMVYAVGCIQQLRQLPVAAAGTREPSTGADMDVNGDPNSSSTASAEEQRAALQSTVRHAFTLLSMLTAAQPTALVASYLPVLLDMGLPTNLLDTWVARHTCLALKYAAPQLTGRAAAAANAASTSSNAPMTPETHQSVLAALVRLLVATPSAAVAPNWPSAAEAAVAAVYAVSSQPQEVMAAALAEMFRRCAPPGGGHGGSTVYGYSAAALSRFFFVLGRTCLQHLLCIEHTSKAIRAARLAADRAAAEAIERQMAAAAAAGSGSGGGRRGKAAAAAAGQPTHEDIGAQLGVGSVAADAELDALAELVEAQILAKNQLLGIYGQLLSKFLHLKSTLAAPQELQECALLALTQLMAVDSTFCADNLRLLFTLLLQRHVSASMRVNMVVALADLASRFPNLLEPWTAEIYLTLADPDPAVKLSALTSLTHLVLGGMVKAKGRNVAQVAVLLVDDVQDINDRAVLFFESLAKTGSGNTRSASAAAGASAANPVYNLLPDCLSTLLTMKDLREEQLQVIMGHLLAYVKDKQAESLRERLVGRLQVGGPREWRLVAWCIGQLGYSEKGLRRIMEMTASYRHALGEQQVFDTFTTMADKARRSAGSSKAAAAADDEANRGLTAAPGDLRSAVEEWVADLVASREAALEAAEVEAMEAARKHRQQKPEEEEEEEEEEAENVMIEAADSAEQQQEQQQQQQETDADEAAGTDSEPKARHGSVSAPAAAADRGFPTEQQVAADPATADAAAGASGHEEAQIELLQSQAVGDDDDLAEEASAEAAALQRQMERLSMAPTPARAAARHHQRPSSAATAAAGTKKGAGAASGKGASRAARRPKQAVKKEQCSSEKSSSSAEDSSDDAGDSSSSSDFEADRPVVPAVSRSRAGRGRRSTAGRAAGSATSRSTKVSQQRPLDAGGSGSSSEDDD